jgi:hypothetical protein
MLEKTASGVTNIKTIFNPLNPFILPDWMRNNPAIK